jgi:hypothetical protein
MIDPASGNIYKNMTRLSGGSYLEGEAEARVVVTQIVLLVIW